MDSRLAPHVRRRIIERDMGWSTPCWVFTGPVKSSGGYARVSIANRMTYLHVYVYVTLAGPRPDGDLDHLCRVRHCCRPDHLDPVTHRENIQRGDTGKNFADRTHCPYNHPYSDENTYTTKSGSRQCRTCRKHRQRKRQGYQGRNEQTRCRYGHKYRDPTVKRCHICRAQREKDRRAARHSQGHEVNVSTDNAAT